MNESLQKYTIGDDVKAQILESLWEGCQPSFNEDDVRPNLDAYFEHYYRTRVQQFSREGGIHICINSHADVLEITSQILGDVTRDAISQFLPKKLQQPRDSGNEKSVDPKHHHNINTINSTIDLCAGLLAMCEFSAPAFGISGSHPLPWAANLSLRQAISSHFFFSSPLGTSGTPETLGIPGGGKPKTKTLSPESPRIPRIFTAKSLLTIGDMKIRWTSNLIDHLLLSDDDQTVLIFPHVAFLRYHTSFASGLFPEGLAEETLRSLAILFPTVDMNTSSSSSTKWLDVTGEGVGMGTELGIVIKELSKLGNPRAHDRRFERFEFWHDRLVILKQAFDEAGPRGWTQWWKDRRNSVQWYTFWVAIWVFVTAVVFGIVQSVEGGLQVYLTWKGMMPEG